MSEQANIVPQFDEELYCSLCYFVYSDTRRPVTLETCDHIYCQQCIVKWEKNTCPFCRKPYTEADIKFEKRYLEVVKKYLNTLRLTNEQALRVQVGQRFKKLEPSLESLIFLEKSIIDYYRKAIKQINWSLLGSGSSLALKSFAAGLCFFPATAPLGVLAMGVTSVTDLGQNLIFIQKKKGVSCEISEAINKHDQMLHDNKVQKCFDLYHELQKIEFIKHFMKGGGEFADHLNLDTVKWASNRLHGIATVINGSQYCNLDKVDFGGWISGKGSGEWRNMPRGLSTTGKVILGAVVCLEWGLFYYEMKDGTANKEDLEKQIENTEKTIQIYEDFLQRSKKNEI